MSKKQISIKQKIYDFFENPETFFAKFVQIFILFLILLSSFLVYVEYKKADIFLEHKELFLLAEYLILSIFTIEYVLRFYGATKKFKFVAKPLNIIDFLAIFPSFLAIILSIFLDITNVKALKLILLLRFSRLLRLFKLLRYSRFLRSAFQWKNTILQAISSVILMFVIIKSIIWILEYYDFWLGDASLGELFAIIGFALGIILSQKISISHTKFIQIEETVMKLHSSLYTLSVIIDKIKPGKGLESTHEWSKEFYKLVNKKNANNYEINKANKKLYEIVKEIEKVPSEMAVLYGNICSDAYFCLSKKERVTPAPYDNLLNQSTLLYLFLITIFIQGFTGMVSVIIAAYILYGMYHLTRDLDSIAGGDFNLININISEFEYFVKNKKWF